MAIETVKYFAGTKQVFDVRPVETTKFRELFGSVSAKNYEIGYSKMVGFDSANDTFNQDAKRWNHDLLIGAQPVTRVIEFKKNPSLHKCDARCRHAKGNNCECSCGGQFHGAGE